MADTITKNEAKEKAGKLVSDHEALTATQVKGYHEAKTKQGFIQPLFRALGWDFDNVAKRLLRKRALQRAGWTMPSKSRVSQDYAWERRISYTDAQIDKVVYELYALTPQEIGVGGGA